MHMCIRTYIIFRTCVSYVPKYTYLRSACVFRNGTILIAGGRKKTTFYLALYRKPFVYPHRLFSILRPRQTDPDSSLFIALYFTSRYTFPVFCSRLPRPAVHVASSFFLYIRAYFDRYMWRALTKCESCKCCFASI